MSAQVAKPSREMKHKLYSLCYRQAHAIETNTCSSSLKELKDIPHSEKNICVCYLPNIIFTWAKVGQCTGEFPTSTANKVVQKKQIKIDTLKQRPVYFLS